MNELVLKDIPNFPDYKAGSDGEIYSLKKVIPKKLKKQLMSSGKYYFVSLSKNGIVIQASVHRLICAAFTESVGLGLEASHLNGNSLDNTPENLIFETRAENLKRRINHGTDDSGVKNTRAKFNKEQIKEIRVLLKEGKTQRHIGELYGVNWKTIGKIARGEHYSRD